MSDKDIQHLIELAEKKQQEAKKMTKTEAIRSLNDAGILTTKGDFKGAYRRLNHTVSK